MKPLVPVVTALHALVGLAGCSAPEDDGWREAGIDGMPDPGRMYLHASAVRKVGDAVYVTHRVVKDSDVAIPLSDRARPRNYRSALFTQRIDCAERRVRMLAMQFFDAQGVAVDSPAALKVSLSRSVPQPIVPGSIADRVWATACWSDQAPSPAFR